MSVLCEGLNTQFEIQVHQASEALGHTNSRLGGRGQVTQVQLTT